jgi:photosynthetic reaction center cytochrome c subunit
MKRKIEIIVLFIFLAGGGFVFTRSGQMQTTQVKTAGETFKNIQVLKDMPADQLDKVMAIFTGALGVKCNFCHVPGQWEKDDKEEKNTARQMIKMMMAIDKENFNGRTEVSCATCHAGRPHPSAFPPLGQNAFQQQAAPSKASLPTIDQVLDKYVQALGGNAALEMVSTRVIKGSRVGADGTAVPEEVYEKLPGKILVVTTYPQGAMTSAYNGTDVWTLNGKGQTGKMSADEAEQFKREAQLLDPEKLKEVYKDMSVAGVDKIGDRDVFVIRAVTKDGGRERLYFDKQSGLLVRRFASAPTVIGMFPFQVDYNDYKPVDGLQVPMTIQWAIPGRTWSRKVTDVKQNITVEDAKFNAPAK